LLFGVHRAVERDVAVAVLDVDLARVQARLRLESRTDDLGERFVAERLACIGGLLDRAGLVDPRLGPGLADCGLLAAAGVKSERDCEAKQGKSHVCAEANFVPGKSPQWKSSAMARASKRYSWLHISFRITTSPCSARIASTSLRPSPRSRSFTLSSSYGQWYSTP